MQCEGIVKFLPPNTTSIEQTIDQEVIVYLKRNYRKNLLQEILLSCNEKDVNLTNGSKNITMKDVIFWAADARNAVKLLCLKKA